MNQTEFGDWFYVLVTHAAWLFATPWTITCQAPQSMEFSRQEYWSCHFLLQGIFLTQGSNPGLPHHRLMLYPLSYQGSTEIVILIIHWVSLGFSAVSLCLAIALGLCDWFRQMDWRQLSVVETVLVLSHSCRSMVRQQHLIILHLNESGRQSSLSVSPGCVIWTRNVSIALRKLLKYKGLYITVDILVYLDLFE